MGIALIGALVLAFFAPAWESYSLATVGLFIAFCLSDITLSAVGTFIVTNPAFITAGILLFIAAGVIWSFAKWFRYCRFQAKRGRESLAREVENSKKWGSHNSGYDLVTEEGRCLFLNSFKPSVRENKARIAGWIAYWPLSIFWTVMTELLRDFFENVVSFFKKQYQAIADRAFGVV